MLTKVEFSCTDLRKILKYQISWNSTQWEPSCSMRAIGQTDVKTVIIAFRNLKIRGLYVLLERNATDVATPASTASCPGRMEFSSELLWEPCCLLSSFTAIVSRVFAAVKRNESESCSRSKVQTTVRGRRPEHRTEPLCSAVPHVAIRITHASSL